MPITKYTYSVAQDTANGVTVLGVLYGEIDADGSLEFDVDRDKSSIKGDVLEVWMLDAITKSFLDAVITAHAGVSGDTNIKHVYDATTAPTANDDDAAGWEIGSRWFDATGKKAYVCVDPSAAAAVWTEMGGGAHASDHTDGTDDIQNATAGQKGLATAAQITKLDAIEASATADQSNAEIKTAYEANSDTNEFSDAEQSKLAAIEASADVTDAANVATAGAVMDSDISAAEGMLRKTAAGAYEAIKTNLSAAVAPGATDDSAAGYAVGSVWIDTTGDKTYVCVDATATAAVWIGAILDDIGSDATEGLIPLGKSSGGGLTEDAGLKYLVATGQLVLGTDAAGNPIISYGAIGQGHLFAGGEVRTMTAGSTRLGVAGGGVKSYVKNIPSTELIDHGVEATRWRTSFLRGLALEYQESAAAQYVADSADHTIILTAATAELVLDAAATVGRGFEMLVRFEGQTSRTITPDSGIPDTVGVTAPTQDKWYRLISDGVSNWRAILLD